MLQILLSFPSTYFFYRIVLNIHHFGTLQVLAVYVILGIGADDIFVLYDAFMQAKMQPTMKVSNANGDLDLSSMMAQRMSWALRRAVSAMAVTSLTTFAAFVVTALSPITNIKVFGIFAALLVATNFILCCLLTPVLITLVHQQKCCHFSRCGCVQNNMNENEKKNEKKKEKKELRAVERFFRDTLTPCVLRYKYLVVLFGVGMIVGFGICALRLSPSDEGIGNIWPSQHTVAVVTDLKSGPFLRGEARFERLNIVFGLNQTSGINRDGTDMFDPTDKGTVVWNDHFDISNIDVQTSMLTLCDLLKNDQVLQLNDIDCIMTDFQHWYNYFNKEEQEEQAEQASRESHFPISTTSYFYGNLSKMFNSEFPVPLQTLPPSVLQKLSSTKEVDQQELLKVMSFGPRHRALQSLRFKTNTASSVRLSRFTLVLNHDWYAPVSTKTKERTHLNTLLDQHWKTYPLPKMGRGTLTSSGYVWMDTQISLVDSSSLGLIVAFILAYIVLFVATSSIVVASISIVSIVGIVSVVLGVMVIMGRSLGFMESICVTVIVGLAVDYVVHIGIAYTEHYHDIFTTEKKTDKKTDKKRVNKAHYAALGAMTDLGVSVLGGAISSFGSALFLLMCVIKYLNQFGEFMALVIITSLFFSTIVYPAFLGTCGDMTTEIRCKRWCCRCLGCRSSSHPRNKTRNSAEVADSHHRVVEMEIMEMKTTTKGTMLKTLHNGSGTDGELSAEEIMSWSKEPLAN